MHAHRQYRHILLEKQVPKELFGCPHRKTLFGSEKGSSKVFPMGTAEEPF
jgi:hypothetical protein